MQQRGRKSSAALEAASPVSVERRPEPPLELTPTQADEWHKVVEAMPADWFGPENLSLLSQYVRHVVDARRLAQLIDQECAKSDCDVALYADLLKQQRAETGAIKSMSSAMRLSQQSKYGARGAETAGKKKTASRPWQSD